MVSVGARACTDITGFGLAGHARNVGKASGVTLRIESSRVPLFEGALELSAKGLNSGGAKRGRQGLAEESRVAGGLAEPLVNLLFDAETSGGLLIAVDAERAGALEAALAERGVPVHGIGSVEAQSGVWVEFV